MLVQYMIWLEFNDLGTARKGTLPGVDSVKWWLGDALAVV